MKRSLSPPALCQLLGNMLEGNEPHHGCSVAAGRPGRRIDAVGSIGAVPRSVLRAAKSDASRTACPASMSRSFPSADASAPSTAVGAEGRPRRTLGKQDQDLTAVAAGRRPARLAPFTGLAGYAVSVAFVAAEARSIAVASISRPGQLHSVGSARAGAADPAVGPDRRSAYRRGRDQD
jgi:hypothetical protein